MVLIVHISMSSPPQVVTAEIAVDEWSTLLADMNRQRHVEVMRVDEVGKQFPTMISTYRVQFITAVDEFAE